MELEVGSILKHFAELDAGGGGGRVTLEEGGREGGCCEAAVGVCVLVSFSFSLAHRTLNVI